MRRVLSGLTHRPLQPQKITYSSVKLYFSNKLGISKNSYSTSNFLNFYKKHTLSKKIDFSGLQTQSNRAKSSHAQSKYYNFIHSNKKSPVQTGHKNKNFNNAPARSEKHFAEIREMAKSILPRKRESIQTEIFKEQSSAKTFVNLTFKGVGHIIDRHYFDAILKNDKAAHHFDYGGNIPLKTLPSLVAAAARYGKVVENISTDSKSQVVVAVIFAAGCEHIVNMPVFEAKNGNQRDTRNLFVKSLYIAEPARAEKITRILGIDLAGMQVLERDSETSTWRPRSSTV